MMMRNHRTLVLNAVLMTALAACVSGCSDEGGSSEAASEAGEAAVSGCPKLSPASIVASNVDGENVAANVNDGNYDTRWSGAGKGVTLRFDYGAVKSICQARIAWFRGTERRNHFVIAVSSDGVTFTDVFAGDSSGTTAALERYDFAAKAGRYLRVTVNGNTQNDWASITEMRVYGNALAAPPPPEDAGTPPPPPPPPPADAGTPGTQTGCVASPSRCGYPDITNTGVPVGTTLTRINGDLDVNTANTVIDGKDIVGCVRVSAPGVTIKRSRITCNGYYGILNSGGGTAAGAARLQIEDVEVVCGGNTTAIGDANVNVKRAYLHGCENGFDLDRDATVQDTFITNIVEVNGGHGDGMQFAGTPTNIVVSHNTILVGSVTSAVNWTGNTVSMRVENNLLAGGGYTLYCPRVPVPAGAFQVLNNRFGTYVYGHTDSCDQSGVVFTGNIEDKDLTPIRP